MGINFLKRKAHHRILTTSRFYSLRVIRTCVSQIDEVFRKKTAVTHDTQNRIINNSGHLISIKIMSIINYDKNVTCEEATHSIIIKVLFT